jgi:uncharacterized membrane protein
MMRPLATACLVVLLACAGDADAPLDPTAAGAHSQHGVSAFDLGPGTATDINIHGDITGYTSSGSETVPWIRHIDGTYRLLPLPVAPVPPTMACHTLPTALNDRGEAVGSIQCGQPPSVWGAGVVWSGNAITMLDLLAEIVTPSAINNRGTVVGTSIFEAPVWGSAGWSWTAQQGVQRMHTSALIESTAAALNASGQVAGTQWQPPFPGNHAYVWSPRTAEALPLDPQTDSWAYAIDAAGSVGGMTSGQPAIWRKQVGWTQLTDLGMGGSVHGMSSGGDAAGSVTSASGSRGAFWNGVGALTVLEPLPGFAQSSAVAINKRGWIIGQSWNTDPYESRATLWVVGSRPSGVLARSAAATSTLTVAQPFAVTAVCSEKWRHFVATGGACPDSR